MTALSGLCGNNGACSFETEGGDCCRTEDCLAFCGDAAEDVGAVLEATGRKLLVTADKSDPSGLDAASTDGGDRSHCDASTPGSGTASVS